MLAYLRVDATNGLDTDLVRKVELRPSSLTQLNEFIMII